jgi:hypothetical protein
MYPMNMCWMYNATSRRGASDGGDEATMFRHGTKRSRISFHTKIVLYFVAISGHFPAIAAVSPTVRLRSIAHSRQTFF